MSELAFLAIALVAAGVWSLATLVRGARRSGRGVFAQLRHSLERRRARRSLDTSIVARGAWRHSLAATYVQGPGVVVIRARDLVILAAAVLAVAGAEVVLAFGSVLVGAIVAAVLVPVLLVGVREPEDPSAARGARRLNIALRALAIVPLMRVVAIAIDSPDIRPAIVILVVGVLGCWLAFRIASVLEIPPEALVGSPLRPLALLVGYLISLLAYEAGAPALAPSGSSGSDVALAVIALVFAGGAEALLFRGVLQTALQRAAGRPGVLVAACLFGCSYLGFDSLRLTLVMFLAGVVFSDIVMRTGAMGMVIVGQAMIAVGSGVVWPQLLGSEPASISEPLFVAAVGVATLLALWHLLRGRGARLSVRRGGQVPRPTTSSARPNDRFADA